MACSNAETSSSKWIRHRPRLKITKFWYLTSYPVVVQVPKTSSKSCLASCRPPLALSNSGSSTPNSSKLSNSPFCLPFLVTGRSLTDSGGSTDSLSTSERRMARASMMSSSLNSFLLVVTSWASEVPMSVARASSKRSAATRVIFPHTFHLRHVFCKRTRAANDPSVFTITEKVLYDNCFCVPISCLLTVFSIVS